MRGHEIRIPKNDKCGIQVSSIYDNKLGIHMVFVAHIVVFGDDVVNNAIHGECALEYWGDAHGGVALVVYGDSCPSQFGFA